MNRIKATCSVLAVAAVLVIPATASSHVQPQSFAQATAASSCGDLNQNTGNIQAHGVGCNTARKVAKAWDGEVSYRAYGFRCRYRDIGYESGKISCRNGSATVAFYTGS